MEVRFDSSGREIKSNKAWREECESLRQQLATVTAERDELAAEAKKFCDDWKFCRGSVRAFQELQIALAKLGADKMGEGS